MADGSHLEIRKIEYLDNALTDCREIFWRLRFWHSAPYGPL